MTNHRQLPLSPAHLSSLVVYIFILLHYSFSISKWFTQSTYLGDIVRGHFTGRAIKDPQQKRKTTQIRFHLCNLLFIATIMRRGYVEHFFTFGIYACTSLNIILKSRMFLQKVIQFNVVMFLSCFWDLLSCICVCKFMCLMLIIY